MLLTPPVRCKTVFSFYTIHPLVVPNHDSEYYRQPRNSVLDLQNLVSLASCPRTRWLYSLLVPTRPSQPLAFVHPPKQVKSSSSSRGSLDILASAKSPHITDSSVLLHIYHSRYSLLASISVVEENASTQRLAHTLRHFTLGLLPNLHYPRRDGPDEFSETRSVRSRYSTFRCFLYTMVDSTMTFSSAQAASTNLASELTKQSVASL